MSERFDYAESSNDLHRYSQRTLSYELDESSHVDQVLTKEMAIPEGKYYEVLRHYAERTLSYEVDI